MNDLVQTRQVIRVKNKWEPHPAQLQVWNDDSRFKVVVAGRRWGKTVFAVVSFIYFIMNNADAECWWVAPRYFFCKRIYRVLRRYCRQYIEHKDDTELRLVFKNNTTVYFRSAKDWDKLVSAGLDYVVFDESGVIPPEAWLESIRATLVDTKGKALFIGTPKGFNWYYDLYLKGQDSNEVNWKSWRFSSYENKFLDTKEIKELEQDVPSHLYEQEILAKFTGSSNLVFKNVDAIVTKAIIQPMHSQRRYTIGIDVAESYDYTSIVVIDNAVRQVVLCQRFTKVSWLEKKIRIKSLTAQFPNYVIVIDSHVIGSSMTEDLERYGLRIERLPFKTNTIKNDVILKLALDIESHDISIYDDGSEAVSALITELKQFECSITPNGKYIYSAPSGKHDDSVISMSLANYLVPLIVRTSMTDSKYSLGSEYLTVKCFDGY